MSIHPPLAEPDELFTLIYQGPLEETPWLSFLGALRQRVQCHSAAMVLRLSRLGAPPLVVWDRRPSISEREAREARQAHARLGHLDPLRNALTKPGDIHTLSEVISREALHESAFYQQVMRPYGIEHELGMYISEPSGWECNVGLINDFARSDFDQTQKDLLSALRPHLERALELFSRIQRNESALEVLTETLDRLTICTFILDRTGRVLRTNQAGAQLVARGDVLRLLDERLSLVRRTDNALLQTLVGKALADPGEDGDGVVEAMRVERPSGGSLGILVRSFGSSLRIRSDVTPAAIVHVAGIGGDLPPERLVAQLFDLTPSEALLATLLTTGLTLAEAAEKLELTENTVRSYSKTIFNKTGVRRQTDLVRLILRSVAVLG